VNRSHAAWRTRRALQNTDEDLDSEAQATYDETRLAISIGQAIHDERAAHGWTQRQLADEAGMNRSDIARLESSLTLPSTPTLFRVVQALGGGFELRIGKPPAQKDPAGSQAQGGRVGREHPAHPRTPDTTTRGTEPDAPQKKNTPPCTTLAPQPIATHPSHAANADRAR
jgi:HTH-type transcriptional regulator/antitoxin HipB